MGLVLLLILVWMAVEIAIWIGIAQFTSGWWVFLWFLGALFVGVNLIKYGKTNLSPMAQQMQQGGFAQQHTRPPESIITKSMACLAAGILLAVPGLISDFFALLLLLPPVQNKLKAFAEKYMRNNQQKMMEMMMKRMQDSGMDTSQFNQQFGGGTNQPFGGDGANPFGGQNPFGGGANQFGSTNPFNQTTTIDSKAKVVKDAKKITHSANDE